MLTLQDIQKLMNGLNDWALEGDSLSKVYNFDNFKLALDFINKVGEIAEKHQHHPDVILSAGSVRLGLTTRSEGGLSNKDFEVAGEIDKIQ